MTSQDKTPAREVPLPWLQRSDLTNDWFMVEPIAKDGRRGKQRRMTTSDLAAVLQAMPEAERAALFAPYLFDGTRRDESSEAVEEAAVDADCERILGMSDEELDAEIRASGRDTERVNRWARSTGRMVAALAKAYSERTAETDRATRAEAKLERAMLIVRHAIEVVHWTALESVFMDMHRDEECGESLQSMLGSLIAAGFLNPDGSLKAEP